jgi:cell division septum initiation protein DivIVA
VLVNRDEVLDLIAEMQEALPDEIKQARWIVKDREELLSKAKADGEALVAAAREEQLKMARQESIVARANGEGERILAEAEATSRAMKREAEEYVDGKLAQFEIGLRKIGGLPVGVRCQDARSGRGGSRQAPGAIDGRRAGVR